VIHQVHLPDVTRRRLTDVVLLQLRLLRHAALTTTPDAASCALYLDRCARFRGRGVQIVAWLWRAPTRHQSLEAFARGPGTEKLQWYMRLAREALKFLRYPTGALFPHIARNATAWQSAGATFLQNFYDDLCTPFGLPGCIFSGSDAAIFHRQELLHEFVHAIRICTSALPVTSLVPIRLLTTRSGLAWNIICPKAATLTLPVIPLTCSSFVPCVTPS